MSEGPQWRQALQQSLPGFMLCMVVGMAASFVSEHYGGPVILYALLMGMAFNYLSTEGRCIAGIQFSAKAVLRFGIALLGARITVEQLMSLGITPIVIVLVAVPSTILFGFVLLPEHIDRFICRYLRCLCCPGGSSRVAARQGCGKESDLHGDLCHGAEYRRHDRLSADCDGF